MKKQKAYNLMLGMLRIILAAFEEIAGNPAKIDDERVRAEAGADQVRTVVRLAETAD